MLSNIKLLQFMNHTRYTSVYSLDILFVYVAGFTSKFFVYQLIIINER